jgi:hypothetical protein
MTLKYLGLPPSFFFQYFPNLVSRTASCNNNRDKCGHEIRHIRSNIPSSVTLWMIIDLTSYTHTRARARARAHTHAHIKLLTGCIKNAWTNFRSEFPTPKTWRTSYKYVPVRKQLSRYSPATCWNQSFRFSSVRTFESPRVFSSNWKSTDASQEHFWCLSNHFQQLWDF